MELDKYNAGKTISWAMTFATLEFVSIEIRALLKRAEMIGTALNIGWSFIEDGGILSAESLIQYELDMAPRLGLKYQTSYIPINSGISRKILVTLPDGHSSTYSLGAYPGGTTIRIPTWGIWPMKHKNPKKLIQGVVGITLLTGGNPIATTPYLLGSRYVPELSERSQMYRAIALVLGIIGVIIFARSFKTK